MIEIKNLSKSFGNRELFKDFSLTIQDGEFIVFSGPSGCGKTTLLNMIGAIEQIDSGTILVDSMDISQKKNQLNYFGNKVGFLFQNFALIEDKTVSYNLKMIKQKNRSSISLEEALNSVGLLNKLNDKIYTLSGGEQQRIALARLMIKKCDIILADEPTGSLDKANADVVMSILKNMHALGKTIILVTHDEDIKKRGERIVEI
ncbi:ATP-binding cassette domain-containing protein [Lysinibacillus sp. CD3-6]|uniref:ATP-binding cassette domain-containing protein n=1 Tax=Lysinibacillus sp. CD3-6 TaxID=2892541 RepID=UPI0011723678|nr:ATP-binding cassette domain-containing protein [Lysinibacillus sp. CD3-6]UED78484.1 ATP-binding cassette domain-containing protein [Lysinibacillus sp. CD3-6]